MGIVKRFLRYIEIKTKITSLFAFFYSLAFLFYRGHSINWGLTLLFFVSMFLVDLTTTALNNYNDTKKNGLPLQFKRPVALVILLALLALSVATGLYLAYLTDIVVLIIGAICVGCGLLYSAGPVPISNQPLGEVLSGIFYGLFIPFIIFYINLPAGTFLQIEGTGSSLALSLQIVPFLVLALLSIPPTATTANIMLANNTCDVERDVLVNRHTLPYYLGKKSLWLFAGLYYLIYASIIAAVAFKILPPLYLLALLTIIPVQKNINVFFKKQDKAETFIVAIKNYIIIMASTTLLIFICGLIK